MPLTDVELEIMRFIDSTIPNSIRKENEIVAKEEYEQYKLNKNFKKIEELNPHTIYLIISNLEGIEQINFIRNNIDILSNNDEQIFIYDMMAPRSLSYYLNYESLKEIYFLDKKIFEKMLSRNLENIVEGFTNEQIYSFFSEFSNEIDQNMKEYLFVNFYLYAKQKIYSNCISGIDYNSEDLKERVVLAKKECGKLTSIVLSNFNDSISKLNDSLFLSFSSNIFYLDEDVIDNFFVQNKEKLTNIYRSIDYSVLHSSFEDIPSLAHKKIFDNFGDVILKRGDLKKYFTNIDSDLLYEYYRKDKKYFENFTVQDWLKYSFFNEQLTNILDDYLESCNFEILFDENRWLNEEGIIYLENKYRASIKDESFYNINEINGIYSNEYINNLEIIKRKSYRKEIGKNSDIYKQHLKLFINHLIKDKGIEVNRDNIGELERYFFQIVKGLSLSKVRKIDSINYIALYNRVGNNYNINYEEFSLEQIQRFNVKEHKLLLDASWMNDNYDFRKTYKTLTLKLMLLVGYERAKYILTLDKNITTLEHLVGNVDVKNIKIDEFGEPVLNEKIINLLFKDLYRNRIKTMLEDKTSDLYKYFPRIFSEWDLIEINKKNKNMKTIIEFLKSDDICVSAKYYRLNGLFKYIGCNKDIVNETLALHDKMIERVNSTIPRVKGSINDYTYEVLKFKDMEGLTIGNRTDCCFTVKGNAYSSLKHALTNKDGRILVVKKNDKLVAHSWLWRNGNVLCLDNIEVAKDIEVIDFFDVYLKFADHIIDKSYQLEGYETCLRNVIVGRTHYDKKIIGIEQYKKYAIYKHNEMDNDVIILNNLPCVLAGNIYSDARSSQVLIKGNGDFKYYDTAACYYDEREKVLVYNDDTKDDVCDMVNGLRYIKYENENRLNEFELLDLDDYESIYCNDDWYILIDRKGNMETYISNHDDRAFKEMEDINNFIIQGMNKKIKK